MKPEELERQYSPGQHILERGAEARELYVVRSGSVILDAGDGSEPRLIGPGTVFGEFGAVLGEPSPYRAEADSEVTLLALDTGIVNRLCREKAEFSMRLIRHLADELAAAARAQSVVGGTDALLALGLKKLIPVLFGCALGKEVPTPVGGRLKDLAEEAGMSMLDTYVCVQRLLECRLLRLVDDRLAMVDPEQLRELSGA